MSGKWERKTLGMGKETGDVAKPESLLVREEEVPWMRS